MSVKLTVLWKGNGSAGASPQALADLVSSNLVQGVIQQSGRAAAVTLKRDDLEKLLASRSSGARSALQAVKDAYAEIGLMREEGVSWAEIAELLGQNGAVGRDGKPFGAATVRAAFFLVGAEVRQGQTESDDAGADSFAEMPMLGDAPTVEDAMVALVEPEPEPEPEQGESGYEPAELPPLPPLESTQPSETPVVAAAAEPVSEPEAPAVTDVAAEAPPEPAAISQPEILPEPAPEPAPEVVADVEIKTEDAIETPPVPDQEAEPEPIVEAPEPVAAAPETGIDATASIGTLPVESMPVEIEPVREEPAPEPLAELIPEDEAAAEVEAEPEFEPDSVPASVVPAPPAYLPTPPPRPADNWLLRRVDEPVPEILAKDEPVPAVVGPTPVAAPLPTVEPAPAVPVPAPRPVAPAPAPEKARGTSPFTHETAMTYDWWTRRIDSST